MGPLTSSAIIQAQTATQPHLRVPRGRRGWWPTLPNRVRPMDPAQAVRQPPPGLGTAARNQSGNSRAGARCARTGDPRLGHRHDRERRMAKGDPAVSSRGRRAAPRSRRAAAPANPSSCSCSPPTASASTASPRRRHRLLRRLHRRGVPRALPRPGAGPAARRRGDRAAAPGRAGHLGQPARPGGGPGRLRPGAAAAGHGLPDLPRARRPLLPRHRPDHAAGPVPRRRPGRLGPERVQVQHVHDRHRRADAARDRLRHGHHHGRQGRHRRRRGGHRLLRRRRHQPGRRQRGVRLGQRLQRADRVLLPEQPVRHLRAARSARPGSRCTGGPPASASPASGSTATTCSPATRSPARRSTTPGTARARR